MKNASFCLRSTFNPVEQFLLSDTQTEANLTFILEDKSVHGGEMLISDPRKWQELEGEHIASSLVIPAKAAIHESTNRFPPSRE
jgi:hypothetical protein